MLGPWIAIEDKATFATKSSSKPSNILLSSPIAAISIKLCVIWVKPSSTSSVPVLKPTLPTVFNPFCKTLPLVTFKNLLMLLTYDNVPNRSAKEATPPYVDATNIFFSWPASNKSCVSLICCSIIFLSAGVCASSYCCSKIPNNCGAFRWAISSSLNLPPASIVKNVACNKFLTA